VRRLAGILLIACAGALGCGCSGGTHAERPATSAKTGASTTETSSIEALRRDIRSAFQRVRLEKYASADELMRSVLADPLFKTLGLQERRDALFMASLLAGGQEDWKRSHALSIELTAIDADRVEAWSRRYEAALNADDQRDAAKSISAIANRWPSMLSDFEDRGIIQTIFNLRQQPRAEKDWLALVESLRAADWHYADQREPSGVWRDLAVYYIEHRDWQRATDVAAHVTDPLVLIGMRSDKQFDRVVGRNPLVNDIDRAVEMEIDLLRAISRRTPQSLDKRTELALSLIHANRAEQALSLLDESAARIRAAPKEQPPYDDMDQVVWVYDYRARALRALGRFDEAVAQYVEVSQMKENGDTNVSQAINLGNFYCMLDRPRDTLAVIGKVGRLSPFGEMQLEGVRNCAARRLHDTAESARTLKYLREHQDVSPDSYQIALALGDDREAGAKLMIARLRDPKLRTDALADAQDYAELPPTPVGKIMDANFRAMLALPDVQKAIRKVGRTAHYNISN
jgi:tetratricopeptide (TPR) repeat protein